METITFQVSKEEAQRLRAEAVEAHLPLGEFVRQRVSAPPLRLEECPRTGAMVFAPAPHLPVLTTESVREMLTDFP